MATFQSLIFFSCGKGGFAVLGSLMSILVVAPWYLKKHGIPLFPFLDLIALYAPLLQSISRIGCFLSGCCYGKPTNAWWAVTYTHEACTAPLNIALHPTQLYSAVFLFGIFCFLYYFLQHRVKKEGQLVSAYVFFMAAERYLTDMLRGDQSHFTGSFASSYQVIACVLMIFAALCFIKISFTSSPAVEKYHEPF